MDKLEAVEKGWSFWTKLPGVAKSVIAAALPIVAISVFVAWFSFTQKSGGDDPEMRKKVEDIRVTFYELKNTQLQFNDMVRKNLDSLKRESRRLQTDMIDLTMITAANSNHRLLTELLPYLQGNQETINQTYRVVLGVQKSLITQPSAPKDSFNIMMLKKKP